MERVTDGNTDRAGMAEDVVQVDGDEPCEAPDPLRRRVCRQPTPAEIRAHRLTPLPFREWCPECVAGAAHDHSHRTRPADDREPLAVPEVHWDYCFPRDADGDHYAVVLVGRDKETRMTVAHVVSMKGADMEWEQAARDLLRFGIHGDVILKSDQEPAIVDVLKEIAKLRGPRRTMLDRRTMLEASPVGDSKSNGVAERAIQSMEKLLGVHKLSIETRINEKLSVRHPLFAWLVEFCTAHQRLNGKHSSQVMVEFGTAVMFRVRGTVQGSSMGERWFHGIFLRKKAGAEENIVMRENGSAVRARAIRELQKILTLKDYDVLRGTRMIRSKLCEVLREM